jgi:hypothetical protein
MPQAKALFCGQSLEDTRVLTGYSMLWREVASTTETHF